MRVVLGWSNLEAQHQKLEIIYYLFDKEKIKLKITHYTSKTYLNIRNMLIFWLEDNSIKIVKIRFQLNLQGEAKVGQHLNPKFYF